jgi:MoaA/NifB/PqqE/SkfB family radical SAM enzyme
MTTITINKGEEDDIAFVLDMAKRLGIDFSVTEKKMSYREKQKAIKKLSSEINRNVTKRLYAHHNIPIPE